MIYIQKHTYCIFYIFIYVTYEVYPYLYIYISNLLGLPFNDPICLKAPAPGINAPAAFHEAKQGGGGDVVIPLMGSEIRRLPIDMVKYMYTPTPLQSGCQLNPKGMVN